MLNPFRRSKKRAQNGVGKGTPPAGRPLAEVRDMPVPLRGKSKLELGRVPIGPPKRSG